MTGPHGYYREEAQPWVTDCPDWRAELVMVVVYMRSCMWSSSIGSWCTALQLWKTGHNLCHGNLARPVTGCAGAVTHASSHTRVSDTASSALRWGLSCGEGLRGGGVRKVRTAGRAAVRSPRRRSTAQSPGTGSAAVRCPLT